MFTSVSRPLSHSLSRCRAAPLLALICVPALAFTCALAHAADFNIPDASPRYGARIHVETCDGDSCSGPAKIELYRRADRSPVQRFETEDLAILLDNRKQPAANVTQLYSDQSAIIIADFNFDGSEDLAIRNGNNSGYGGPSYDVYVYHATKKRFVPAADLTELASSKLGMFQIDAKRKRLVTFEKSGCCWHMTTEYAVVPGKGLLDVYSKEEAVRADGERVDVIVSERIETKVGGQWRKSKRTYKVSEYYKQ
jgi:hypothetical protein